MNDGCPLCNATVRSNLRIGTSATIRIEEEASPKGQEGFGACAQGHELTRRLDEYGLVREPWRQVVA